MAFPFSLSPLLVDQPALFQIFFSHSFHYIQFKQIFLGNLQGTFAKEAGKQKQIFTYSYSPPVHYPNLILSSRRLLAVAASLSSLPMFNRLQRSSFLSLPHHSFCYPSSKSSRYFSGNLPVKPVIVARKTSYLHSLPFLHI